MKYQALNKRYGELIADIETYLIEEIEQSNYVSRFGHNAIKVNIYDYVELTYNPNERYGHYLMFVNSDDSHTQLLVECTIDDLLDILNSIE